MRCFFMSVVLLFVLTFTASAAPSNSAPTAVPTKYSDKIEKISLQYGLNPRFVQAVIWRESRFKASARGKHGEIGLMQLKMDVVRDWAKAHRRPAPSAETVFDPDVNLHIGIWHLDRALRHWEGHPDQVKLALFEYNSGRKAILRRMAHCDGDVQLLLDTYTSGDYAVAIVEKYVEYSNLDKPETELAQF